MDVVPYCIGWDGVLPALRLSPSICVSPPLQSCVHVTVFAPPATLTAGVAGLPHFRGQDSEVAELSTLKSCHKLVPKVINDYSVPVLLCVSFM